ncbi:MAG: OmpA family protein [Nitrospirae bacterium]|nr:OmpA family protein [Nitrospirota bacterium]
MNTMKVAILAMSVLALAGTASASVFDFTPICCDGGYEYRHPSAWEKEQQRVRDELAAALRQLADRDREIASLRAGAGDASRLAGLSSAPGDLSQCNACAVDLAAAQQRAALLESQLAGLQAASGDKGRLAADLASVRQRMAELERQLAERDKELVGLRSELSAEMTKLKDAQRGLIRALHPQIEKGDITVDLNSERLLIHLASSYLFGSGEDQLEPAGADALKQVGAILKEFPEYQVAVDGHTDNQPIRSSSSLIKKFPTNKELSEARAVNAAKALAAGGLASSRTAGYADAKPVASNTTEEGRAKNRRVEVRVTR